MYTLLYSAAAKHDAKKLYAAHLDKKCQSLLDLIQQDPLAHPPPCEKLLGDLSGYLSRRINIHHRLVYEIDKAKSVVKILRMWTHYE